jgi:hypothetical protein
VTDPATLQQLAAALPRDGELPYPERRRIRQAIAAQSQDALIRLEANCARHSFPVWEAAVPDDRRPLNLLNEALDRSQNSALTTEWQLLKTSLDDMFELGDDFFPAIYAGFACWAAVRDVIGHIPKEPDVNSEIDIDPELWSPCFFASLAVSRGATWEPGSDPDQRRRYWEWYLINAIPACLSSPTE